MPLSLGIGAYFLRIPLGMLLSKYSERENALEVKFKRTAIFNNTNSQELVGKTAIYKGNIPYKFSNHITRIRVNKEKIIPEFLWLILNIYQQREIFYAICTNWNNQSGVGTELLKST